MTSPTITDPNQDLWDHLQDIWDQGQAQRQARIDARRERPMLRLWDADWNLKGLVHNEIDASFTWRINDTGTGVMRLPMDHRLAPWILDIWGRKENVHVTMDKDGARWGGRLRRGKLRKDSDGVRYIELQFLHDYENLKRILVWSNAFLPAALQFPRIAIMAGPSAWVLKVMLLMNLRRVFGAGWRMPSDPLDPSAWRNRSDIGQWETVVMPGRLEDDASPWTIASSRFKYWHDMAESTLADAELMVDCRRWLEGDPEPWPGANLRNGTLVVDIVDKSGQWSPEGAGSQGSLLTGILRTVTRVVGEGIDDEKHLITAPTVVPEYETPGWLGTVPRRPFVTYRDGSVTGVEAAEFTWEPSQAVRMTGGGHSMPGVNELLSAGIQLAGNTLGQFVFVPTLGTIADTILRPLYTDTILAWMSMQSPVRALKGGWSHYQEHFAKGADRAYTISGLVAMREAFWETRARTAHQLEIADGAPWFVGDRGVGHFFLGDRISSTVMGLPPDMLVVEQVSELTYSWSRDHMGWQITLGDFRSSESPLSRAIREVSQLVSAVHDLGVI